MEASKQKQEDKEFFEDDEKEPESLPQAEKLKKQSSYTYWVQNNREQFPQHKDKEMIAPKKIEDPELLKKLEQSAVQGNGSAWNKAGTW